MTLNLLFCLTGFGLLYFGAEWLVKGSSSLARTLGITPLVVGLTVVAFGTSSPELVVSLVSSVKEKSMIAVGNVVGSNICNIALVLGVAALFRPIASQRSVVGRDIPVMLGISLSLFVLLLDSRLGRIEGVTLFGGIILYTIVNYHIAMRKSADKRGEENKSPEPGREESEQAISRQKQIVLIVAGITGVVLGAEIVIDSAVEIMRVLGVSEKFMGLTIVAFGTSVPELATSVVAALRREMDISIGNLVGSNVFNILSVLGAASIVRPICIPGGFFESGLVIDYLVMLLTSLLPMLMMRKTLTVTRRDGLLLLFCYVGYVTYLIAGT